MSPNPAKASFYESHAALEQYLFFHYGNASEYLPWDGPTHALHYPSEAVRCLLDTPSLTPNARALDLGCAVGGTSFALSRNCGEVIGLDLSRAFIRAANRMKKQRTITIEYIIEGDIRKKTTLRLPSGTHPERVRFITGDAMNPPASLGSFDVIVMLNLIDRLPDPARCLSAATSRLRPGGQLVIASPYTWLEEYTPKKNWLGGKSGETTLTAIKKLLCPDYRLAKKRQIPFIIREHARKFQWSVAEGTLWVKKLK